MSEGVVYTPVEMEVIYSCCKFIDHVFEILKSEWHAPLRCRDLFHIHAKKGVKNGLLLWNQDIVNNFSGNVYFGSWNDTMELEIIVRWKHLPDTLVKAIYEKPISTS